MKKDKVDFNFTIFINSCHEVEVNYPPTTAYTKKNDSFIFFSFVLVPLAEWAPRRQSALCSTPPWTTSSAPHCQSASRSTLHRQPPLRRFGSNEELGMTCFASQNLSSLPYFVLKVVAAMPNREPREKGHFFKKWRHVDGRRDTRITFETIR
jgi:hypothetical protein